MKESDIQKLMCKITISSTESHWGKHEGERHALPHHFFCFLGWTRSKILPLLSCDSCAQFVQLVLNEMVLFFGQQGRRDAGPSWWSPACALSLNCPGTHPGLRHSSLDVQTGHVLELQGQHAISQLRSRWLILCLQLWDRQGTRWAFFFVLWWQHSWVLSIPHMPGHILHHPCYCDYCNKEWKFFFSSNQWSKVFKF